MTFEDAETFSNHPEAIWFRSGDLSVIQDSYEPLSYPYLDDNVDISQRVQEDPQLILRSTSRKLYFKWLKVIEGRKPRKCYSLALPLDPNNGKGRPLAPITVNSNEPVSKLQPFAPLKAIEEIFDVSKDPETLDDSEIEELLLKSPQEGLTINNSNTGDTCKLQRLYLIVAENSIYSVGDVMPLFVHRGIDDCQFFSFEKACTIGLIMVTVASGHLYGITVNGTLESVTLTYSLDLGSEGLWCIRKHQGNRQFMVFNSREGICKFFEIGSQNQVVAINNLILDDLTVLECTFFPSDSETHFFLFAATLQSERLKYYCIEWDTNEAKMKKAHYLTYWTDYTFEACAPLGDKKIIVFYNGILEVISANQLMSGETDFTRTEAPNLRGICDHFHAPKLLEALKRERAEEFSKFEYCLVVGTTSGHINACLIDNDDQIFVFSMTRFKGLKSLCSMDERADLDKDYPLIVISYGRTIELFIDIDQMKHVSPANPVSSFSGLSFKHTLDSSSEGLSQIMVVSPRKRLGRYSSELWLTSATSITNFQSSGYLRKVYHLCKLRDFPLFKSVKFFPISSIDTEFKNRLSKDLGKLGQQMYLILAVGRTPVDVSPSSMCFTLDFSTSKPQLTEIDELMVETKEECFEVFLTSRFLVQVSSTSLYVQSLSFEIDDQPKVFSPGWQIDGVTHFDNTIIIWNNKKRLLHYLDDIDSIDLKEGLSPINLSEDLTAPAGESKIQCQIVRGNDGELLTYLAANSRLLKIKLSQTSFAKAITLCSGQIKSMICLKNWLCFVRNGNEIIAINHLNLSQQVVELDFGCRDIQLRKMNEDNCLVFSTQEVAIFTLSEDGSLQHWFYDLNLPYELGFNATITDVKVDEVGCKVFLQRFDGLHIFEMSFFSWNRSKYILRSTRDPNKKFIFVEKLNRMLVINFDSTKWDCIKLSNGKTLSLNPSVLFEESALLVDVTELPTENKSVALILNFARLIKLVYLLPQRGKIIVKEAHKITFDCPILPFVAVRPDGGFYVLRAEHKDDSHLDDCTILSAELTRSGLEITQELSFRIDNVKQIQEFKTFGRDIVIHHALHNCVILLRDIRKALLRNELRIGILNIDPGFELALLHPLNDDCLATAVQSEDPHSRLSRLLFFHRSDLMSQGDPQSMPAGEPYDYFMRATVAHASQETTRHRQELLSSADEAGEDDDMDEMDELDAFARPAARPAGEQLRENSSSTPYHTLTLSYHVKDVAYDAAGHKLFVLAADDSVIVYQTDAQDDSRQGDRPQHTS